jgi:hypothetical protein
LPLNPDAAINHVITEISHCGELPQQKLMVLTSLLKNEYEFVYPLISDLANEVTDQSEEKTQKKWL